MTVSVSLALWLSAPAVPVIVKVNVPLLSEFLAMLMVAVVVAECEPSSVTELGDTEHVAVDSPPVQASETVPVNAPIGVTVAVYLADFPIEMVCEVGEMETEKSFRFSVAALVVAVPQTFVNTARYWFPVCEAATVNVRVVEVAPGMFVKLAPLLVLTCHCTVGAGLPLAPAVKVTLLPALTLWLAGFAVIAGGVLTVSVAALVIAVPALLMNTARYWFPFWAAAAVNIRLVEVAPAILLNVEAPLVFTCHCTVGAGLPVPAALKVTVLPTQTVVLLGLVVTEGMMGRNNCAFMASYPSCVSGDVVSPEPLNTIVTGALNDVLVSD
jgi:hypothetical protein